MKSQVDGIYPVPSFFYSFRVTPCLTMEEEHDADFEASALGTLD
jgi:hypothetical protein